MFGRVRDSVNNHGDADRPMSQKQGCVVHEAFCRNFASRPCTIERYAYKSRPISPFLPSPSRVFSRLPSANLILEPPALTPAVPLCL